MLQGVQTWSNMTKYQMITKHGGIMTHQKHCHTSENHKNHRHEWNPVNLTNQVAPITKLNRQIPGRGLLSWDVNFVWWLNGLETWGRVCQIVHVNEIDGDIVTRKWRQLHVQPKTDASFSIGQTCTHPHFREMVWFTVCCGIPHRLEENTVITFW